MSDEVHVSHCCARHGCKYGLSRTCPVASGMIGQEYPCEVGSVTDPCLGPIQVPDVVRRACERAFWNAVGPSELTTEGAQDGLRAAMEAALDAWEEYRQAHP